MTELPEDPAEIAAQLRDAMAAISHDWTPEVLARLTPTERAVLLEQIELLQQETRGLLADMLLFLEDQ